MSALGAFNTQLIRFFEELVETYPEERDIKLGLEAIQGAKKINPKLILDLFYEHVYKDYLSPFVMRMRGPLLDSPRPRSPASSTRCHPR